MARSVLRGSSPPGADRASGCTASRGSSPAEPASACKPRPLPGDRVAAAGRGSSEDCLDPGVQAQFARPVLARSSDNTPTKPPASVRARLAQISPCGSSAIAPAVVPNEAPTSTDTGKIPCSYSYHETAAADCNGVRNPPSGLPNHPSSLSAWE